VRASQRGARASTASWTASSLLVHEKTSRGNAAKMATGGQPLVHARKCDSTLHNNVRRCVRHLAAALVVIVCKQRHLQTVAVVYESVVEKAATAGAKHALYKRGANDDVPDLIKHHLHHKTHIIGQCCGETNRNTAALEHLYTNVLVVKQKFGHRDDNVLIVNDPVRLRYKHVIHSSVLLVANSRRSESVHLQRVRRTEPHAQVYSAMNSTSPAHAVTSADDLRVGMNGEMLHDTAQNIIADALVRLVKSHVHLAALQHQRDVLQDRQERLVRTDRREVGVHGHRVRFEVFDEPLQTCCAPERYPQAIDAAARAHRATFLHDRAPRFVTADIVKQFRARRSCALQREMQCQGDITG
jgi:hypothetical protein